MNESVRNASASVITFGVHKTSTITSQMYAKNISTLLFHLVQNGDLHVDLDEEITASTLVSRGGDIIHPRIKELLTSTKQSTTD